MHADTVIKRAINRKDSEQFYVTSFGFAPGRGRHMNKENILKEDVSDRAAEMLEVVPTENKETPKYHEVELTPKEIRRNMTLCIMLDSIWCTGWSEFALAVTPLLVYLGASNKYIGFLLGAGFMSLFGSFVSPWISQRFRIKKWYLIGANIPYLAPIGIAGIMIILSKHFALSNAWLLGFLAIMILAYQFFTGFVALPHQEYVAACIPNNCRGRYTGMSATIGSLLSLGSTAIGGLILLQYVKPLSFGVCFLLTWIICQGGYVLAAFAKERPTPVEKAPKAWSRQMFNALREDNHFLRVIVLWALMDISFAQVMVFVPVFGYKNLGMIAATAAVIQIIGQVVRMVAFVPLGALVDKIGGKRILPYSALISGVAYVILLMLSNQWGVYIAIAILGFGNAVLATSTTVLTYGLPKPENRSTHYTMQILLSYGARSLGAILVGLLCDVLSFRTVFIATAIVCFAFFMVGRKVLEPLADDIKAYS